MTVKGNTAICGGKRLSSKELKASNAHHFLKDGDILDVNNKFIWNWYLLQCGTQIYRTSAMDLRHQMIENIYNDYIYIFLVSWKTRNPESRILIIN